MTEKNLKGNLTYTERSITQYSREIAQFQASSESYRETVEKTAGKCERLDAFKMVINQLVPKMAEGLEDDLMATGATANLEAKLLLTDYDAFDLSYLTLRHVLCIESDLKFLRHACEELGNEVEEHARFKTMMEQLRDMTKNGSTEDQKKAWSTLKLFKDKTEKHGDTLGLVKTYEKAARFIKVPKMDWSDDLKYRMGQTLVNACIKYTGCIEVEKTYRAVTKKNENPRVHIITATADFANTLEDLHGKMEILKPKMKPMVCKPKDWTSFNNGGLLTNGDIRSYPLVRTRKQTQRDSIKKGDFKKLFDVVNKLQATEWSLNKRVCSVIKACWDLDNEMGKLPPQSVQAVLPPEPWKNLAEKKKMRKEKPPVYREYIFKCITNADDWRDKKSLIKAINARIEIMEEYWDQDRFWYTYFCDYRLRLYLFQHLMTPQGDDTSKASIMFANGEPLDSEEAVWWWMVHGANCFGVDKVAFSDRVQWVKDNHDEIVASAADPMTNRFWTSKDCDKPFGFLAFCFEYADWIKSGKSQDFLSYIPIAMDGSCNGTQHLCALSRSMQGERVNLVPQEKPADFYTDIANICEGICEEWMYDDSLDDKTRGICAVLKGKISRKLVKRPCMTISYSATFQGFIGQISDEIKKADAKIGGVSRLFECEYKNFDIAVTLAKLVTKALEKGMDEPMSVMTFIQHLNKCCVVEEKNFEWKTPMGMVVSQAYTKTKRKKIDSWFGEVKVTVCNQVDAMDKKGQPKLNPQTSKNGSAPNVIHSFDSAHLQRVLLRGWEEGIKDWAMIHDSFGCHARFCGKMRRIINEEFVAIYNNDVLQELYEYTKSRLDGEGLDMIDKFKPLYGTLDISQVLESDYFFA